MATFELKAGASVDLLTPEELDSTMGPIQELLAAIKADMGGPTVIKGGDEVATDGSGLLGGGLATGAGHVIFRCPVGYEAFVHRLKVTATGYTPTVPLTTGEVLICRNGTSIAAMEAFLPVSGVVAPVVMTEGGTSAIQLLSGETLVVVGDGLPVNTNFFFGLQLRLWKAKAKIDGAG